VKIFFWNKVKIKTFSDEGKLRGFVTRRSTHSKKKKEKEKEKKAKGVSSV